MSVLEGARAIEHALARATAAGARQADALLAESDTLEARVRGEGIDFVKQARERTLGIRAFMEGPGGLSQASTSTSDLSAAAIERMAEETVALARATAPDPMAGLPEGPFASGSPDLRLLDPADREVAVEARIADAREAESAARAQDPRIVNSEGSQVSSVFSRVSYGHSEGFLDQFESASHSLFSEPIARVNGAMQRDYWLTVGRSLASLEDPESVGRRAAERAVARLGARRVEPVVGELAAVGRPPHRGPLSQLLAVHPARGSIFDTFVLAPVRGHLDLAGPVAPTDEQVPVLVERPV